MGGAILQSIFICAFVGCLAHPGKATGAAAAAMLFCYIAANAASWATFSVRARHLSGFEADTGTGRLHLRDHAFALQALRILAGHLLSVVVRFCHGLCRSNWRCKSRLENFHLVHVFQYHFGAVW